MTSLLVAFPTPYCTGVNHEKWCFSYNVRSSFSQLFSVLVQKTRAEVSGRGGGGLTDLLPRWGQFYLIDGSAKRGG